MRTRWLDEMGFRMAQSHTVVCRGLGRWKIPILSLGSIFDIRIDVSVEDSGGCISVHELQLVYLYAAEIRSATTWSSSEHFHMPIAFES